MTIAVTAPADVIDLRYRFLERHKLLAARDEVTKLADQIKRLLMTGEKDELRSFLSEQYPADVADAMFFLDADQDKAVFDLLSIDEAAEVMDEVDLALEGRLAATTSVERLASILNELPSDEGADLVGILRREQAEHVLRTTAPHKAIGIRSLLAYPPKSAGGIMSLGIVSVSERATQAEVLQAFRNKVDAEHIFFIFVVDKQGALCGMVDLHSLLRASPDTPMRELMLRNVPAVTPQADQDQVAAIFARYDLTALPVVEPSSNKLLGVITADDVIDVLEEEATEDALRMAGSDAAELEKRSPARIALLRLPWIMATMFIELLAGVVIHFFDQTLASVLLLASFMPIISAISGNTGLQSATIIVRGLSGGQVQLSHWQHAVSRQLRTTLILGLATGLTLGVIGAIWYGKPAFGLVILIGMFMAVNIAGIVGTVVPLISTRLGFDPALTSGPFETAFQDVAGISIFLTLATLLLPYLLR